MIYYTVDQIMIAHIVRCSYDLLYGTVDHITITHTVGRS